MNYNHLVNDNQLFSSRVQLVSQTWTLPPLLMRRRSPWRPVCQHRCCTFSQCSLGSNVLSPSLLASAGAGNLKARFENMAKASEVENKKRAEEEKARRQARESRERELAKRRQEVRAVCTPRGLS